MPRPTAAVVHPAVAAANLIEEEASRLARVVVAQQQRQETRRLRASIWAAAHIPLVQSPEAVIAQTMLEANSEALNAALWAAAPT
jgi:DNA polymerase IIIc chi subunit